jgi:tyrosine-protein phosphatase YwqE
MIDINNKSFNFYNSNLIIENHVNLLKENKNIDIFTESIYVISEKYIPFREESLFFNQFKNNILNFNNIKSQTLDKNFNTFTGVEFLFSENSIKEEKSYIDFCLLDSNFLLIDLNNLKYSYQFLENELSKIINNKVIPIITHPERLAYQMEINNLKQLKDMGVLFQLSLASLAGNFGENIEKKSINLLQNGVFDFIASDTTNYSEVDNNFLEKNLDKSRNLVGSSSLDKLIYKNPLNIIDNKSSNNYQI